MIARTHRFHGYGSLNSVYRSGQTVRGSLLSVRYASRDPRRPYRVAVVVSRKVSKSAVTRNRIRRRVYEAVRRRGEAIAPGTDLIFTVFSDQLATQEPLKLETTLADLLKKTGNTPRTPS
jgi:ribonuclease P protein component